MKKNTLLVIIITVMVIVGAGLLVFAITNKPSSTDSSQAVVTGAVEQNTVDLKNFAFSPVAIKVKVGTKVTWTNTDDVTHTVTSDDSSKETFKSDGLKKGATYSYTFTKAGTFTYHCVPHPYMHGTVVVTE